MFDDLSTGLKILIISVFTVVVVLLCYIGYTLFDYHFGTTYQYGTVVANQTNEVNATEEAREQEARLYTTTTTDEQQQRHREVSSNALDIFGTQQHLSVIPTNTKAWLSVDGVDIHDPVMQTDNNEFYLTHNELGQKDVWGCYYFTCTNDVSDIQNLDRKTIIFGHSNGATSHYKFSTLKNFKDAEFAQKNQFIHLTINGISSKWQIFAAGDVPVDGDTFMEVNPSDEAFKEEVLKFKQYSYSKFECPVQYGDHIIILCTCTGGKKYDTRFLVCAKLIA